ncbi:MAG: Ig-like domain-containing protein [Natronomonas sp.]
MRGDGSFVDDQRGVSAVLGFVLMFALVMTTFAIYQSDVVPHQNAEVESSYSQSLDGEVSELRSTTMDVAASGAAASETIQGTPDYPDRALGINAPPPKSRLSTTAEHSVSIAGLETAREQYWDGSDRTFETRLLAFEPSYNYIRTKETYYLANGVGVHESGNGSYASSVGGEVVDGDQIDIVLLDGDVSQQASVHDVSLDPVSTNSEYHSVTPETGASIEFPTVRSESAWTEIAAENPNINGTDMSCAGGGTPPCDASVNAVEIDLNESVESYDFRVTKVSLEEPSRKNGTYVTMRPASGVTASEGQSFTVTVRDEYGNPISGASVSLNRTGPGVLTASSVTTDDSGEAIFGVKNAEIGVTEVTAEIDDGYPDYETTSRIVGGAGAGGTPTFAAYTSGQYRPGMGDIESLTLSEGQMVPNSEEQCLLLDDGGGLLGGLLGAINCVDDDFLTLQGSLRIQADSQQYTFKYQFVDDDRNGNIDSSDDSAVVEVTDRDGNRLFWGELTNGAANRILSDSGADLLEPGNYADEEWEFCGVFGLSCAPRGHTDFDDFDLDDSDVFVEEASGRVTVTADDN